MIAAGAGTLGGAVVGAVAWVLAKRRRRPATGPAGGANREPVPAARGLRPLRARFLSQFGEFFRGERAIGYDELEELLVGADVGMETTTWILQQVRERVGAGADAATLRQAVRRELSGLVEGEPPAVPQSRPYVVLIVGVNGVGKTTTVGKLAALHRRLGRSVLLVAADTFRAAAIDQLQAWADRTESTIVRHSPGGDPSAVVFDGLRAGVARGIDVVLIDSAGRLHTRDNLMAELAKLRRVIDREVPGAPHETYLVLDATTGQNALSQARTFVGETGATGVIMTKLDGTAKGGVLFAIRRQLGIPVRYIGVGEGAEDLQPFDGQALVDMLFDGDRVS
jgi:fused signal recognition particle receptor